VFNVKTCSMHYTCHIYTANIDIFFYIKISWMRRRRQRWQAYTKKYYFAIATKQLFLKSLASYLKCFPHFGKSFTILWLIICQFHYQQLIKIDSDVHYPRARADKSKTCNDLSRNAMWKCVILCYPLNVVCTNWDQTIDDN
jgi:hypothetical protein